MNNNDHPFAVRTRMHLYNKCGATGEEAASHTGPPAVLIRWLNEWPPINVVPLAGETVFWDSKPCTVVNGIPWRHYDDGPWHLDVRYPYGAVDTANLDQITRTPPVEKVTGEKVGTLRTYGMGYGSDEFHAMERIPPGTYAIVRVDDE